MILLRPSPAAHDPAGAKEAGPACCAKCGEDERFGPATHHPSGWRLEAL